MTTWKKQIRGCFGLADRKFAGHPSDEERAFELLTQLRRENIGWEEFEDELRKQLEAMPQLHTDEQVEIVRKAYRFWLLD